MSDWALSACERQEFSIALVGRGAANTKGAYVQLIAATSFRYEAVTIQLHADGGGGQCYLVDISIGAAAAEQVIIPDILLDSTRGILQNSLNITIPIAVPEGVRLSARVQEVGGAGTRQVRVTVIGRAGGSNYPVAQSGSVVNYGVNVATSNGVLVDMGTVAATYGASFELIGSTIRDHNGLIVIMGTNQQASALADVYYNFQIGIGPSLETIIAEWTSSLSGGVNRLQVNSMDICAAIPSGTRISMRSKCSGASAATRHTTAIILGY